MEVPEIRLSGGEPFVITDLSSMCTSVVEAGISYTLTTNGVLLNRHLHWLIATPPSTLWISFHREYHDRTGFHAIVAQAANTLPNVGINIFAQDICIDPDMLFELIELGVRRVKILQVTPVGRGRDVPPERHDVPPAIVERIRSAAASRGVEVRIEGRTDGVLGPQSCVLRDRSLYSINEDGRVYACCITLGAAGGEIGDLRKESLAEILTRGMALEGSLPCRTMLPDVSAGTNVCPLHLKRL